MGEQPHTKKSSSRISTIDMAIQSLGIGPWREGNEPKSALFRWPPDVFAVCGTLLRDSGAYLQIARPHKYDVDNCLWLSDSADRQSWPLHVHEVATEWRSIDFDNEDPPAEVLACLKELAGMGQEPVHGLSRPDAENFLWTPVFKLLAYADESSRGAGIIMGATELYIKEKLSEKNKVAEFLLDYPGDSMLTSQCMLHLIEQWSTRMAGRNEGEGFSPITLCKLIDPTRAIVLPKMRTSQRGITIRSLSLHLALLNGCDIEPNWYPTSNLLLKSPARAKPVEQVDLENHSPDKIADSAGPYNLVLLPWPFCLKPSQFQPAMRSHDLLAGRPPSPHSFFNYEPESQDSTYNQFKQKVGELLRHAESAVGPINGLLLPEMAMSIEDYRRIFSDEFVESLNLDLLVCGILAPPTPGRLARNSVAIRSRNYVGSQTVIQDKHHRWALDGPQITTYGLGGMLRPQQLWWEGIEIPRRSLNFFSLDAMTAFTVLICEDLARPDPVGDVIRAVGPNLVICLLFDGPQLKERWSARYAHILADDPGSSVLTLSSLGMVGLSRRRDKLHEPSRVVAMWREPNDIPVELQLPGNSNALVISLAVERSTEQTIDGRTDNGMASILRLAGVIPLNF